MHRVRATALALLLVAGAAAPALAQEEPPVRFDGHRALRVSVRYHRQYQTVLDLADDILTCEGSGVGTFDVRMSPEHYAAFVGTGIPHQVLILDLQAHLDQIAADDAAARNRDD